jgi:hypothetical protein
MTITVTNDSDGTITVTCGGETIKIGGPTPSDPKASGSIPIFWPNDGHTASIIAGGKAKTKIISVASVEELPKAIRENHALHAKAAKPVILQFNVKADKPLQIGNINKVLSDLGHPDWMGMIINLTGPRR